MVIYYKIDRGAITLKPLILQFSNPSSIDKNK